MPRSLGLALAAAVLLASPAAAKRGDIYIETDHYNSAANDYDAVHLLRVDSRTGAVETVVSSTALPTYSPPMFARADGTILLANASKAAVVSPSGGVRAMRVRLHRRSLEAIGFLASGGAAFNGDERGIYTLGPSLSGSLRLLPGSRRAHNFKVHVGGIVRELVASDGSIISQVTEASPGGRFALTHFRRFDPRTQRLTKIVTARPIRHAMQGETWCTLPGGGIVVATGRKQHTVFYVAKPRRGLWSVRRFGAWSRPIDDGGIQCAGLPGGDIAIARQTTKDNGGFVLDQGIQVLRMAPGGKLTTLYDVPPGPGVDNIEGSIAVQP